MNFGKSLKIALAMKDMKQHELGAITGHSPQQVSNWVTSGRISLNNQRLVCAALGMKLSEIIALGE